MDYLEKIETFTENNLLSLDEVVMGALELFEKNEIENFSISEFKKPLIAWSGNAIVTAKIIFSNINAIFCDETNFDICLNKDIDWLIIVSASWEKHASIFAEKAKERGIITKLLTCNSDSSTAKTIWKENVIVTKKNREPYTYNTSTYLWWILAVTWEKPTDVKNFIINRIDPILKETDFSKYKSYLLVTPDNLAQVNQLLIVKFIELFWRKIARDVFSYEQLKHAITIIPDNKELCISFWEWKLYFDWNFINFPLPKDCNLWTIMVIWYYIIWKIQNSHPQYFKENIWKYIADFKQTSFWKNMKVIIE